MKKRQRLNIRERLYLEDLKKQAKMSVETKLRQVLLFSDFLLRLKRITKIKNR